MFCALVLIAGLALSLYVVRKERKVDVMYNRWADPLNGFRGGYALTPSDRYEARLSNTVFILAL